MSSKKILVPTDFTKVAESAINHALEIAETINGEVFLLHVIAKQSEVHDAKAKLEEEAERARKISNIPIHTTVRIGNIFDDIGDAASELDAELILMGTHGMKGLQFITGSHALKVITHSVVPFIVVQEGGGVAHGYNNIVVPLDLSKETKQKLELAANMAKYFNSKIHLITPKETDEFLHNQLDRNLHYAENYMAEHGINFTATIGEEKSGNFYKEIIRFAKDKNADLITIMNLGGASLMGMLGSSYEQNMITNEEKIPVMCVNPVTTTVGGSVLFS